MTSPSMVSLVEEYLAHRRKLGFTLQREGEKLLDFAHHAEGIGHKGPITASLVVEWAKLPKNAAHNYWVRRFDLVRRFAEYRATFEPGTKIPAKGLLGPSYRRPLPYIYSDEEISKLLRAASELQPHEAYAHTLTLRCSGCLRRQAKRHSARRRTRQKASLDRSEYRRSKDQMSHG